ncbi:hypothetical protein U2F10_01840 [Leptothoe sp. EHU-05/26/07-4]
MSSKLERFQTIWRKISQGYSQPPMSLTIPQSRVDLSLSADGALKQNARYFQVRINELHLSKTREWFTTYQPFVFVVSEFIYDNKIETVPFIVGPSLIEKHGQPAPQGMIFANTRVAGLHPYRGGKLNLSILLCRIKNKNYVKELLQLTENAASVLDFSTALTSYLKIGNVLLDGIESLFNLGDTKSLIGLRQEFDPDAGDNMQPGYFALIDTPEAQFNSNHFWVRNNQLLYGMTSASAKPFREADYVLYSLVQTSERQDVALLPFYSSYEDVKAWASKTDEKSWEQAKASMSSLYQEMVKSPDLISSQMRKLVNQYVTEMRQLRKMAIGLGALGAADEFDIGEIDETNTEANLTNAARILDLKL